MWKYLTAGLCALTMASPAAAELPEPVRAMIDAAIATGDPAKVSAVTEIARTTNPDDLAEIDALESAFKDEQQQIAEAQKAAEVAEIRNAGLFDNWNGKGEIGGFRSAGNSSNTGLSAALALNREGIDWSHKLRGRADFQRSGSITTREQYLASYEPRYRINSRLFAYGLAQYERDRFQGFTGRYAVSGGLGYRVIDTDRLDLAVKAGPAYRVTDLVTGESEERLAALFGMDFDWRITDRLTLTQDTNAVAETGGQAVVFVDSNNTSLNVITGLDAKVSNNLTARLSYQLEYDSNPPAGAVKTDTLTRFTLVYGF